MDEKVRNLWQRVLGPVSSLNYGFPSWCHRGHWFYEYLRVNYSMQTYPGFNFIQLRLHTAGLPNLILRPPRWDPLRLFLVGLSAPMVQVGKDITWQDSLILENEVSVLNNVLYADLTGVFLVVGCTLFISLVNCLSEIPTIHLCSNYR